MMAMVKIMKIFFYNDQDDAGKYKENYVHNNQDDGNLSMTSRGLGGK